MVTTSFSERLKMVRGDQGQVEFAMQIGVHKNTVSRWERGEQTPSQADLVKILEINPSICPAWLVTGEGPMQGFAASEQPSPKTAKEFGAQGELVVSDDMLEIINEILKDKLGDRSSEINTEKTMTLIKTLHRFYSRNFIESAMFRRDTMEKNIESLVKLALPEKDLK